MLLGQALWPGDEAQAQRSGEEVGEIIAETDFERDIRILRKRLAGVRNRNSAIFQLREINENTRQICLLLGAPNPPPECL